MDQNIQQFFITNHKHIIFLLTQKSYPKHRVYRFQRILRKFPNLQVEWRAGKIFALPVTLSQNLPHELHTRKTTVEKPQKKKLFVAKKRNITTSRI